MGNPKAPFVPPELVDWLASIYPDRCPDLKTPDRDIWYAAGQAQVVRKKHFARDRNTKADSPFLIFREVPRLRF